MQITAYAYADHAHDHQTRRSVAGIMLFINSTPINRYSKRQSTIETSTYGAELVALRITMKTIIEFRYKLRMMGIPVIGPNQIFYDNKSDVLNTTLPPSTLKKKHNAIAYHRIRKQLLPRLFQLNICKERRMLQTS